MGDQDKRLKGYRRLIDISRDLASTLDLDILLNRIVHAAADLTEAQAGSILLYDEPARQLNFQVATNLEKPALRGLVVPLEGSIAGWMVINRKPVRIANVHSDPRHFGMIEKATRLKTQSLMGVPLITKDKVIGVLEVINKHSGEFTELDEDFLTVLGAQAAVAIENTRLFQQSDLVAEFVHELRTPLASIGTATYLLLRPEISQEQREQIIRNIHSETQRLTTLASSFLDLARLESGRVPYYITRFNLRPLLEECRMIMQGKADENLIQIILEMPAKFPKIEADRDKIKQLVLNLLSNAIKYNCRKGSVTVRAESTASQIILSVQDTGIGIPEDALPHLFERYYRVCNVERTAIGTGLGLSICKHIVQDHDGQLEVKSQVGKGTTVIVRLPRKAVKPV